MSIINVIEWTGSPSILAWRHPNPEIMLGSQLIVREHQHAIFVKEGRMIGPFLPGRHTLDTKNIPVLKGFIGLATGGRSPFPAEVWFVNRTVDLNVRWGTATPIHYDRETVESHFRGILLSSIKTHVARALGERKLSILDMAAHLTELSEDLGRLFRTEFAEFGLSVSAFRIESITTREDDDAVLSLRRALARRAELKILGTDFAQAESFEVMKKAAANEGGAVAPFVGAGLGLSMGATMGAQAGPLGTHLAMQGPRCGGCGNAMPPASRFCPGCGLGISTAPERCGPCQKPLPAGARFCPDCGAPAGPACHTCRTPLPTGARFCPGCGIGAKEPRG